MKEYSVVRTYTSAEYCTVEAESEKEAIKKAQKLSDDCWEANPNDVNIKYDYNAEEVK